jgi:hypothetical protein
MAPTSKSIPLPSEGVGSADYWKGQLDWAADVRKDNLKEWRRNANAYREKLKPPRANGVRVPVEFEKTEQKRHQLFYRMPALKLRAHPRTEREAQPTEPTLPPEQQQPRDLKKAIAIFREVLSLIVGPTGANMKPSMDQLIFDVLCPSGIAFAKVGYERHTDGQVPMETGVMLPDPNFVQPGAMLGLTVQPPMVPEIALAPNVVEESYYFERISPAQALIPAEFRGSDYSGKAPWLAHEFPLTKEQAEAKGWTIRNKSESSGSSDTTEGQEDRIVELDRKGNRVGQLKCRELFYYASLVDPNVKHPKKIRRLVFVEGEEKPVVHEDCKDQKWDARGRLIGGIEKLPIKVLTLRYVSDCAYPPSDCSITRRLSNELSEFRTGQIEHRRKAVPRVAINVDRITNEKIKKKIIEGVHYDDIPVSGDADIAKPISQPQYPNDNWISDQRVQGDIDKAWALGIGTNPQQQSGTTATEVAAIERATDNRLAGERETVMAFWLEAVEAFGQLVQLYADREDYVQIVGENGAKSLEAWDKETVAGKFIYEVVPDSSLPPDAQADRDAALNWYNLTANDPFFEPLQNRRGLAEAFGHDAQMVQQPQPPAPQPKEPEPLKVSVSMKLEDLLPGSPLADIGLALLSQSGAQVSVSATTETPEMGEQGPAKVVDRERLRMAEADMQDQRAGGLVGVQ